MRIGRLRLMSGLGCALLVMGGALRAEASAPPHEVRTLYPSDRFAVQATPCGSDFPGQHVNVVQGTVDLSEADELWVDVSNRLDRTLWLMLSVKSDPLCARMPEAIMRVRPQTRGRIVCSLQPELWRLDAPLELVGMKAYPKAADAESLTFDLRAVSSLHVFTSKGERPDAFEVLRVAARSRGGRSITVLSATNFLPFVDRYGQYSHADWPGKIHCDAELEASASAEKAWLAEREKAPFAARNRWGGWTDGPQLRATGFFRTEKVNGKWWLVDPDGRLFWSHGIDCVGSEGDATPVTGRESYFAWLPRAGSSPFGRFWGQEFAPGVHGYYSQTNHVPFKTFDFAAANRVRKYGAIGSADMVDLAHRRLRAWGMNTIGNWSEPAVYEAGRTPYTLSLGTHGAPRRAKSKGFWGPLPDPENPEFARIFRARAKAAARKMKSDPWCLGIFVDNELSWHDLPDLDHVAEVYFRTVAQILKEELPNHLYLGSRFAHANADVYRAAARHCDVVSVNVYGRNFWRDLPEGAADKPMINGEFHFRALDRGLMHTGGVATRDQSERAACYRSYVRSCLDHPRVVGTHWFKWRDQPVTGRSLDGENFQIGFLSVTDDPYMELVQAARQIGREMYERRWGKGMADVADGLRLPSHDAKP